MTKINTVQVNKENFMSAMKCWPSGVVVVTTSYNGVLYGFSACSFVGISLDPALVSFSKDNSAASIKNYLEMKNTLLNENSGAILRKFENE
jgi:flavin reductase (DIM6/NTAB) family NADH-FMN oxidoreductase RutF